MVRTMRVPILLALVGCLAFILGLLTVPLLDSAGARGGALETWSIVAALLSAVAVFVGTCTRMLLGRVRGVRLEPVLMLSGAAVGAATFAGVLAVFVLGLIAPPLLGMGGASLDDYPAGETSWREMVGPLFVLAGLGGGIFGAFTGFIAWLSRFVRAKSGPPRPTGISSSS